MNIPVEVSARHVHLSKEVADEIFGKDYIFKVKKNLSQPGQFACEERVSIVGPRGVLEGVSVLGPLRNKTQAEISLTDSIKIGIKCPIRESGDLKNSASCILKGPKGEFKLSEGLIIAKRHVHMTPKDAEILNVKDGEVKKIRINSCERAATYDDVAIRVNNNFSLAMHIDTDEANALNYAPGVNGEVIL